MVLDAVEHLQFHVRQGAHRQRDLVSYQGVDHIVILLTPDTVVDTLDLEHFKRVGDVLGRSFLASVGNRVKPSFASHPVGIGEPFGRVSHF